MKVSTYSLVAALAFAAPALQAAVIVVTPLLTSASGSTTSSTTTIGSPRTINAALNGSGLTGAGDILSQTHVDATSGGDGNAIYLSATYASPAAAAAGETITLDLGAAYDLTNIYLWAYSRAESGRGIQTFNIAFDTGSGFGTAVAVSTLGIANFNQGPNGGATSVQTRTFTSTQTGVQRIRLTNITTFGGGNIAIAEMRFGAVPEPSAALLGGIGALLLLRRRRN